MNNWTEKLLACQTNIDRANLASDLECDPVLLRAFCIEDLDPLVVEQAILNPNAEDTWVNSALERFPMLNTDQFWRLREINIQREFKRLEEEATKALSGDRDQIILKHIFKEDKVSITHANSHLGKLDPTAPINFKNPEIAWAPTEKYRVAMVMAPAWGVIFPPYNIAKLVGIIRSCGYSTKVYDLNIESYHRILEILNEDYWQGNRYYLWTVKENFYKYVMPHIKDLLIKVVNELVESNPRVVGFSLYNTNLYATEFMIKELRSLLPDVCIVVGGPEVATTGRASGSLALLPVNYFFVGEAEETLPYLLENLPETYERLKFIGTTDSKLTLESYPYPDYSDYKLSNYQHRDGVSIETSRGCVAQCSFCAETYFWKFRSVTPERVVDEMEHQIKLYGIKRFWFVDSLVNGNLKNFEKLIDLIIEKNLNISWNSYVRCDGRMTKEFLRKVVKSGCTCLSYGVESGSQKVLYDMRKKIDVWEIENNLRDGFEEGIYNHINWLIGFPTEEPIDFLHSLQLLANLRKSINVISPGFGAGPAAGSHMNTDWGVYGIVSDAYVGDKTFLNSWYTEGHKNTLLHRFIRIKLVHVWLEILDSNSSSIILNSQRYNNIKDFYRFITTRPSKLVTEYIEPDTYVKLDRLSGSFSGSIINEYFGIFYALYRYFGKSSFSLAFDPEVDKSTFGESLSSNYKCDIKFDINENGNYSIVIDHEFINNQEEFNFKEKFEESGNIESWVSDKIQTKETIHEKYRNNSKKVIPIQVT